MKRKPAPMRVKNISTRVTDEEYKLLLERADQQGLSISEWARRTLEKAISDAEARRVLMAELFALRFVLLNTLPQMIGATDSTSVRTQIERLIVDADLRKAEKARRLLGES